MQLLTDKCNAGKAKNGRPQAHESQPDPTPSLAVLDPKMRLAAGVVVKAFEDLRGADLVLFLDSLTWLVCGDAWIWLEALGWEKNPTDLLDWIVEANHAKKSRITCN